MARVEDQTIMEAQIPVSPVGTPVVIAQDAWEPSTLAFINNDSHSFSFFEVSHLLESPASPPTLFSS